MPPGCAPGQGLLAKISSMYCNCLRKQLNYSKFKLAIFHILAIFWRARSRPYRNRFLQANTSTCSNTASSAFDSIDDEASSNLHIFDDNSKPRRHEEALRSVGTEQDESAMQDGEGPEHIYINTEG